MRKNPTLPTLNQSWRMFPLGFFPSMEPHDKRDNALHFHAIHMHLLQFQSFQSMDLKPAEFITNIGFVQLPLTSSSYLNYLIGFTPSKPMIVGLNLIAFFILS